jgi:Cu/Ag efflux protein CusF
MAQWCAAFNGVGHMKKALALGVVLVFCAAVGLAAHGKSTEATITKVDMAAKSMVVKTTDGKEMTIYWNDSTKVQGTPKEGETVHFRAADQDGKSMASWVHVGKMEPKTAAPATSPK